MFRSKEHGNFHHHEDSAGFKARFVKHVDDLTAEIEQLGNPFLPDESGELIQLGTKDVMGDEMVATVRTIKEHGKKQWKDFRVSHHQENNRN